MQLNMPSPNPVLKRILSKIASWAMHPHGANNVARLSALLAGMPKTTAGVTINRFCSSGLQAIAMAANHIRGDGADCAVAGGVESISMGRVVPDKAIIDPGLLDIAPANFYADDRYSRYCSGAL